MNIKELMIGDWVRTNWGRPERIEAIYRNGVVCAFRKDLNDISPIPLTADILEKNGFEYHDFEHSGVWCIPGEELGLHQSGDQWVIMPFYGNCTAIPSCHIKYVHELQHMLGICHIEKDIIISK